MRLGFGVEALAPAARVSGPLRMGLVRVDPAVWLQPDPDRVARSDAFEAWPDSVMVCPEGCDGAAELAAMLDATTFDDAARSVWEDLCVLTRPTQDEPYRLTAAAVAFPTDWRLADKIGTALHAVHAPIHGYAQQLSDGVDRFLSGLASGPIYGRANLFVVASDALRYCPADDPFDRFAHVTSENAGQTLFVRCERQTLRRLPETGAIVFTIGVYVRPLRDLSASTVARAAATLDGMGEGESARRAAPAYADALRSYAGQRAREGLAA